MKTERFFFTTTPQGVTFGGKRPKELQGIGCHKFKKIDTKIIL